MYDTCSFSFLPMDKSVDSIPWLPMSSLSMLMELWEREDGSEGQGHQQLAMCIPSLQFNDIWFGFENRLQLFSVHYVQTKGGMHRNLNIPSTKQCLASLYGRLLMVYFFMDIQLMVPMKENAQIWNSKSLWLSCGSLILIIPIIFYEVEMWWLSKDITRHT